MLTSVPKIEVLHYFLDLSRMKRKKCWFLIVGWKEETNKQTEKPKRERIFWMKWGSTSGFSGVQRSCPGVGVSSQVSLLNQDWHVARLKSSMTGTTHLPRLWWHKAGTCAALSKWDWKQVFRDESMAVAKMTLLASFTSCHPTCNNSLQESTPWSTMARVKRTTCTKTFSYSVLPVSFRLGCQALRTELLLSMLFGKNILK